MTATMPVGVAASLQNGYPFDSTEFASSGQLPLLRIRDILATRFETFIDRPVPSTHLVKNGDLVIGMDGDFNLKIWDRGVAALNQRVCRLRARDGHDIRFVAYALPPALKRIREQQFVTTVAHLSGREVLQCRIPACDSDAQRRISDFLDERVARIDQIIAARHRGADALGGLVDRAWSDLTDQLDAPWVPIRRFLMSIVDGPFGSSLTSAHYSDFGTRVIRLGNLGIGEFRPLDRAFISDEYASRLTQHAVLPGDLLMAGLGDERWPLGRCVVAPSDLGPAIVKADCYRIRLDARIDHEYAAYALSSPPARSLIALNARGSTRSRLNTEVARTAELPFVDLDAQGRYVAAVRDVRRANADMRRAVARSGALLQEYKQSLITAAVTGELDVTTASTKIPGE